MLMVRGFIDISASAVGCLTCMLVAMLMRMGIPWPLAILICLVVSAIVGFVNSVLINKCGFQPFIVTMAMAYVVRGLMYIICGTEPIPIKDATMIALGTGRIGGFFPYTLVLALIAIIVYGFILSKTYFGKSIYMMGGNPCRLEAEENGVYSVYKQQCIGGLCRMPFGFPPYIRSAGRYLKRAVHWSDRRHFGRGFLRRRFRWYVRCVFGYVAAQRFQQRVDHFGYTGMVADLWLRRAASVCACFRYCNQLTPQKNLTDITSLRFRHIKASTLS